VSLRALAGGRADVRGRVPAHSLAAEVQCLVHGLGDRRDAAIGIGLGLEPRHFYNPAHARIWEAIATVAASPDAALCLGAVLEWLRARGWLDAIGGEPFLRTLTEETALTGPMRVHARTVLTLARVRAVQAEAHLIAAEGYGDVGDPDAWLESIAARVTERAEATRARKPQSFAETLKMSWTTLNTPNGGRAGYPTGLEPYDAATGGLHPGEVLLISAKEKAGKSMLAGQWFAHLADGSHTVFGEDGQPVLDARGQPIKRRRAALIFALDAAKRTDWAERVAGAHVQVDLERFRLGLADDRDREALASSRLRTRCAAWCTSPAKRISSRSRGR
jgi:replicative DNA helicase